MALERQIVQVLEREYAYDVENIVELYGEQATQEAIREAMATIFAKMKSTDVFLAFVALKSVPVAGDLYFVPSAGKEDEPWTLIPVTDFDRLSISSGFESGLLVYSSCQRSGAEVNQFAQSGTYGWLTRRTFSRILFCASDEEAAPFAEAFLASLQDASSRGHWISASQLTDSLRGKARGYDVVLVRSPFSSLEEFGFLPQGEKLDTYLSTLKRPGTPDLKMPSIDLVVKTILSEAPDRRPTMVGRVRETLLDLAGDSQEAASVRSRAISALADLEDRNAVEKLSRFLRQPLEESVKKALIDALGRLGGSEAAEGVRHGLIDPSPAVRIVAIRAIGHLKDESSVPAILARLRDDTEEVQIAAIQTSATFSNRAEEVRRAVSAVLNDPSPTVRREAVSALGALGKGRASPELVALLENDKEPAVRQAAALTLGRCFLEPDRLVVERSLLKASEESNASVREATVWALGEVGGSVAEKRLIRALGKKGEDSKVRRSAAEGLGKMKSRNGIGILIEALKTSGPEVKQAAAQSLGMIGDPQATEALLAALKDSDPYVRGEAQRALKNLQTSPTKADLLAALQDPSARVRKEAVQKLADSGSVSVVPYLIDRLADEDDAVRRVAISGLARFSDTDSLRRVGQALADPSPLRRQSAAVVLGTVARPDTASELRAHAGDAHPAVRAEVIRALAKVRAPGHSVPQEILEAAKDKDPGVRLAATEALGDSRNEEAMLSLRHLAGDSNPEVRQAAIEALRRLSSGKKD